MTLLPQGTADLAKRQWHHESSNAEAPDKQSPTCSFMKQTHCKALMPLLETLGVISSQVSPARRQGTGTCWTTSSTQAVQQVCLLALTSWERYFLAKNTILLFAALAATFFVAMKEKRKTTQQVQLFICPIRTIKLHSSTADIPALHKWHFCHSQFPICIFPNPASHPLHVHTQL